MAKIILPEVGPGNSGRLRTNDNFRKLEEAINDEILFRKNPPGEPNEMNNDLDMNSKRVYNLPIPTLDHEATPWGEVKGGVPAAKKWAEEARESALESAESADESAASALVATEQAERAEAAADEAEAVLEGAVKKVDLASDTGSSLVGFLQEGVGAISRTVLDKDRDIVSVKDFGAAGDGVTVDQSSIQSAVDYCLSNNSTLDWPAGNYVSTANITNFHNILHEGTGRILRGAEIFSITPLSTDTNILYTGAGGTGANDGLGPLQPRTVAGSRNALYQFGNKSQLGQWRLQFVPGTCTENGLTFYNMPMFAKPLQVWGVLDGGVRTAIWDGTSATSAYAFRADKANVALNVDFQYMKFTNWHLNGSTNTGAICCWFQSNVTTFQNEFDNCGVAIWCRGGRSQHYGDIITNCDWGIGLQYCHSAVVGSSAAENQVYISNCEVGVFLGRQSIAHIDYTHFSGNGIDIIAAQKSRAATDGSTYANWGTVSIRLESDSIHEQNGATWDPDSITDATPIYYFGNGGSVPDQHFGPLPYRTQHYSPQTGYTLSGTTDRTMLSAQTGFGSPLRMRKQMLYNTATLKIIVEARIDRNNANGITTISLTGPGATTAFDLCTIDLPAVVGSGRVVFEITFRQGSALAVCKYECSNPAGNVTKFQTVTSAALALARDKSQDIAAWRLYATHSDPTGNIVIYNLSTTVQG